MVNPLVQEKASSRHAWCFLNGIAKPAWTLVVLTMLHLPGAVQAQVIERFLSAEGRGHTRSFAIHDALSNASGQAFGLRLQSNSVTSLTSAEITTDTTNNSLLIDVYNRQIAQQIRTPGERPILGFTVDQAERESSGIWTARVTIRYADFQKLGAASDRRSLAVFVKPHPQSTQLLQAVEPVLVSGRRFNVLTRDSAQAFEREARFLRSGEAAPAELARLAQGLGADYLVIVEFDDLRFLDNQREHIHLSGETYVRSHVLGAIRLEVVEMATRKKKWVGRESIAATFEGAQRVDSEMFGRRLSEMAAVLIGKMTAAIYPIEIVRIDADRFVINRGAGAVRLGERFQVFKLGEELKDPQSGESLGEMESAVGWAEVREVSAKFSSATMLGGQLQPGARYVLRALLAGSANEAPPRFTPARAATAASVPQADNRTLLNR